tara:strand:+ start:1504 stop:1689 length:186 start_codon:yes stop_codon:yes gene_type:complete
MVAVIKRFVELLEESISVRITVDSIWLTKYKKGVGTNPAFANIESSDSKVIENPTKITGGI